MLIHENILFHNAAELTPAVSGGLTIQRFPESIRNDPEISQIGHVMVRLATKCELRFFADAPQSRLFLSSPDEGAAVNIHRGDLLLTAQPRPLLQGAITEIDLTPPPQESVMDVSLYPTRRFPHDLWRLSFNGSKVDFLGIDPMGGDVRPPCESDQPAVRMLAYGSSISMAGPTFNDYLAVAAEELGWDVLNLGMAGSCHIEPVIADWIAAREDWDVGVLELGVNMAGQFEPEVFEKRARHLVEACIAHDPSRPIALLSAFRWSADARAEADRGAEHSRAYRRILRQMADDCAERGPVHFIDGLDLTPDFRGFRIDLTHPADAAHFRIGLRLAERLENVQAPGSND